MIPSVLARQLREGVADYIETTFPMTNHLFKGTLSRMLGVKNFVFHEPYVAVRLPFRVAEEETVRFEAIQTRFRPYLHQQKAFERLTDEEARSTLIATGTGSGKTECFLYPILEYCYRHRGEPGIKAILIYPMNALASDQARRIARLIHESPQLRGNVRAGMYVGGYEANASSQMGEDRVITDHEAMLHQPPDILLTNYKMLDYLLVRPKDAEIWRDNAPDTLKFIAVDELHTFDGAQGTDLACLIRRLKARLGIRPGHLCCIGTSATMGSRDSAQRIRDYASSVFGESFGGDSVITEDRLSPFEFFAGHETEYVMFPTEELCRKLQFLSLESNLEAYLTCAAQSWLGVRLDESEIMSDETRIAIGRRLMKHGFLQYLLAEMGPNYVQIPYLCEKLSVPFPDLSRLSHPSTALDALFALVSHARSGHPGNLRPFLQVQVQFWMRELSRMLARVSEDNIEYALYRDLNEEQAKHYLPVINCRDCGETGWVGILNERQNAEMVNLDAFYNLYFAGDSKIRMFFPTDGSFEPPGTVRARLCSHCLQVDFGNGHDHCSACGKKTIPVIVPLDNVVSVRDKKSYECPFCGSRQGLSLIGLRTATAISVVVSQLYASGFNDDKKLLAFSDNVQDAAHRAGFFNSRAWRFSLRAAIQHFALAEGRNLPLEEFQERFVEYWHAHTKDDAEFVSLFIAPNMTWMRAYERMKETGQFGHDRHARLLMERIEKRLKYEIMLEYGLSSRIGRTLEKSGSSVLRFDPEALVEVAELVRERTVNELGALSWSSPEVFRRMVMGFLHIMRSNGAFADPVFHDYTMDRGDTYKLTFDKTHWTPGVKPGRNTPRFIYKPNENIGKIWNFDTLTVHSKYASWIESCIGLMELMHRQDLSQQIAQIILEELIRKGIVVAMPTPPSYSAYALSKSAVWVSTSVRQFVCDRCGTAVSASEDNSQFWEGAPCIRVSCGGQFYEDTNASLDYYGKLYSNGDLFRVIAREHTGLLERNDREELERSFKRSREERKPWDTNLLSSTPTLEMGIDVGDLSTVVLCNMPPGQAQFLQRAGRAGRRDGNALTVAVANARPHDLYFYADPMEMIQGKVAPPRVFLRAPAVLERQFVAFCMDNWIKRGGSEKAVPDSVGECLNKMASGAPGHFPDNFLQFVQNHLVSLIDSFIEMFQAGPCDELDEDSIRELKKFALGKGLTETPLHRKVREAFEELKRHRDALIGNMKQLNRLIRELERKPQDSSFESDIQELKLERTALKQVIGNLNSKHVYNFMTDEGLLPNYTFPEAGIVLKAVLIRKEDLSDQEQDNPKRRPERLVYEYTRNAAAALSEFAPANHFYVDGKKLRINQVDMKFAEPVKWRLCPNCSYAKMIDHEYEAACPRCGSPAWADTGQVRSMLKVRMVYSHMRYDRAQIDDESDDRSTVFYCRQLLVDVDEENDVVKAYRMDNRDFSFGYEFVRKATIREINFGEKDIQGERLTVAGVEEVRKGFRVCRECGKLQADNSAAPDHAPLCSAKHPRPGVPDPIEECLFLYREFITEVLRILVPSTSLDFEQKKKESFVAAFMLGMKEYFGNVDHLRAAVCEVPVPDTGFRKQYLVIYDTVPGGTGYLKQLLQNECSLVDILEKALAVLENCTCKEDPQKDGCYRCLYAYQQSQNIGRISRKSAIRLLKQILGGKDNLVRIDRLAQVPVNDLFESELERRFVLALERMGTETRPVHIEQAVVNGKVGYLLKVGDCSWEVEPQVELDALHGIYVRSRVDFVLWPSRKSQGQKPVVVFTDGFSFHKNSCIKDTLQREAIRRSGHFRVWTFSWDDIEHVFRNKGDYATATLIPANMPSGVRYFKQTVSTGNAKDLQLDKSTPMKLLMRYLEMPDAEHHFQVHARALAISLLDVHKLRDRLAFDDWLMSMRELFMQFPVADVEDFRMNECMFGTWSPRSSNCHLRMYAGVTLSELQSNQTRALPVVFAVLNDRNEDRTDRYEADWNGFWHFYNVMQFSNRFAGATVTGLEQMAYGVLPSMLESAPSVADSQTQTDAEGWSEVFASLLEEEARQFAARLQSAGAKVPSSVGYALQDDRGVIIAECELAWEQEKVAALLSEQIGSREQFERAGWTVFTLEDDIPKSITGGGY